MIPLPTMSRGSSPLLVLPLLCTMNLSGACGSPDMGPAVAIPELGFNRARVPIGGPLEMTYRFNASPAMCVESVRMYVIRPTGPSPGMFTPS
mgnify:CR=1 FL=1